MMMRRQLFIPESPIVTSSSVMIMNKTAIVLAQRVSAKILVLRNQKVILDTDLANLYGVSVKRLNEQVKRNPKRFPPDFLFTLTEPEYENLRSRNAT
jgi:hypothetical protein